MFLQLFLVDSNPLINMVMWAIYDGVCAIAQFEWSYWNHVQFNQEDLNSFELLVIEI